MRGPRSVPYLALLPMGFSVPPRLRLARWALTPPFHPYLPGCPGGRYVLCGTVRQRRLTAPSPACIRHPRAPVTRHRALWSSDFPPQACARSEPPPSRSRLQRTAPATRLTSFDLRGLRARLIIAWGPAARDFGGGPNGIFRRALSHSGANCASVRRPHRSSRQTPPGNAARQIAATASRPVQSPTSLAIRRH